MSLLIIDAHAHLWEELRGDIDGLPVKSTGGGRSTFKGEVRQMMPPYMLDGKNSPEVFIANMEDAGVAGAVITQEFIDGEQNGYLLKAREKYPERFKICALADFREAGYFEQISAALTKGFDGVKVPAQWLVQLPRRMYLTEPEMMAVFKLMENRGVFLSIDLAEGVCQTGEMREVLQECPELKVAIGHFGMVTRKGWEEQIRLAESRHVFIESGGITWLFHKEFYPFRGAVEAVKRAADLVGMHKLMWGSDYPRTMTAITYRMSFDFFERTDLLSEEEKVQFLGGNAERFYGFEGLKIPVRVRNMVED